MGFFRCSPKGQQKYPLRGSLKIKGLQVPVYRSNSDKTFCRISVAGSFSVRAGWQATEEMGWSQERVTDRRMSHHSLVYLITIRGTAVTIGHNGVHTMWNCPRSLGFKWYVATSSQSLNEINNGRLRDLWKHGTKLIQSEILSCEAAKYRVVVSSWDAGNIIPTFSQIYRDWWRVLPIHKAYASENVYYRRLLPFLLTPI